MADYQESGPGGKEVNVSQCKYDTEVGAADDRRCPVGREPYGVCAASRISSGGELPLANREALSRWIREALLGFDKGGALGATIQFRGT